MNLENLNVQEICKNEMKTTNGMKNIRNKSSP